MFYAQIKAKAEALLKSIPCYKTPYKQANKQARFCKRKVAGGQCQWDTACTTKVGQIYRQLSGSICRSFVRKLRLSPGKLVATRLLKAAILLPTFHAAATLPMQCYYPQVLPSTAAAVICAAHPHNQRCFAAVGPATLWQCIMRLYA